MSDTESIVKALAELVARGDFTIPAYPAVALRLQKLLASDSYGVNEVERVISTDAALATSVLAAANCALGGTGTALAAPSVAWLAAAREVHPVTISMPAATATRGPTTGLATEAQAAAQRRPARAVAAQPPPRRATTAAAAAAHRARHLGLTSAR